MKPYYYVYRYGHHGPQARHGTIESAQKEAERLAEQHPESSFEILKCVGHTRTTKVKTFWMDGEEPKELTRPIGGSCQGIPDNSATSTQKFNSHYEPIGYPVTPI